MGTSDRDAIVKRQTLTLIEAALILGVPPAQLLDAVACNQLPVIPKGTGGYLVAFKPLLDALGMKESDIA